MITKQRALENLGRYDIDEIELSQWENELGLDIPVDQHGNKVYTSQHLNLFKNVKKHLTLGRSITEIKKLLILPVEAKMAHIAAQEATAPQPSLGPSLDNLVERTIGHQPLEYQAPIQALEAPQYYEEEATQTEEPITTAPLAPLSQKPVVTTIRPLKRFASLPRRISSSEIAGVQRPNTGMLLLVDRLMAEKDHLQSEVIRLEKQKAHLYQGNELFKDKLTELEHQIEQLNEQLRAHENIRLLDDKSKLQKELLLAERKQAENAKRVEELEGKVSYLKGSLSHQIDSKVFVGSWLQEATIKEVAFDNFGINIDSSQSRIIKITHPPERQFGHAAILETVFDYQTNTLWKRTELLMVSIVNENRLEGEMIAEYILDGSPVARALYKVRCQRQGHRPA